LLASGAATLAVGLYIASAGTLTQQPQGTLRAEAPPVTATANSLPPASPLEPTPIVTATAESSPEAPVEEVAAVEAVVETPPAPEPPAPPVEVQAPAAPPPPAATATPRPPAPTATRPVPTATPEPPPAPPPAAPANLGGLESAMLASHDQERAKANLPAFTVDGTLTQIARQRAQDMASRNYFSHTSPTGQTAFTLLNASGYGYALAGENLARNNYPESQTVSVAMQAFMASQAHRVNVLEAKFTRIGIGMAVGADGMKYFAVVFAQPR
jgi:uncharacterized protein YkwD